MRVPFISIDSVVTPFSRLANAEIDRAPSFFPNAATPRTQAGFLVYWVCLVRDGQSAHFQRQPDWSDREIQSPHSLKRQFLRPERFVRIRHLDFTMNLEGDARSTVRSFL